MSTPFFPTSFALGVSLLASACELGARTVGYEPIDEIEPGVERELTRTGPCDGGERGRVAADPAGSVGLFVWLRNPGRGGSFARTYDVADEANVVLSRGNQVFSDFCNQIDDWGQDDIEEAWIAPHDASQHGIVEVELDSDAPLESLEFATVTLVDVTLRREGVDDEPDLVIDEFVLPY